MTFVSDLEPTALWRHFDAILTAEPGHGEEHCRCGLPADPEEMECPRCGSILFSAESIWQLSIARRASVWQEEAECPCCGWDTDSEALECPCCGYPQPAVAEREAPAEPGMQRTRGIPSKPGARHPSRVSGSKRPRAPATPTALPATDAPTDSGLGCLVLLLTVAVIAALVWLSTD